MSWVVVLLKAERFEGVVPLIGMMPRNRGSARQRAAELAKISAWMGEPADYRAAKLDTRTDICTWIDGKNAT